MQRNSALTATSLRAAWRWAGVASETAWWLTWLPVAHHLDEGRGVAVRRRWAERALRRLALTLTHEDANEGRYDDPPYLFVHLNQVSLVETFIYPVVIPLPLRILMNVEFAAIPAIGPSLWLTGSRTLVRQWPAQAKRQMARAAADMRDRGRSFAMSVEGRRSPDGRLSPYRGGAAWLAIESQARLVPFWIDGTGEALPVGAWRVRPGRLHARTLEAIDCRGLTQSDRRDLTARLRALAEDLQPRR